jgi:hypothetical protein
MNAFKVYELILLLLQVTHINVYEIGTNGLYYKRILTIVRCLYYKSGVALALALARAGSAEANGR